MPKNNPNCPLPDIREARIDPTLPEDRGRFALGPGGVRGAVRRQRAQPASLPDRHVQTAAIVSKTG